MPTTVGGNSPGAAEAAEAMALPGVGCRTTGYSAGTAAGVRCATERAVPTHSRLASSRHGDQHQHQLGMAAVDQEAERHRRERRAERQAGADEAEHLADLPGRCRVLQHDVARRAAGAQRQAGGEHQRDDRQARHRQPVHRQHQHRGQRSSAPRRTAGRGACRCRRTSRRPARRIVEPDHVAGQRRGGGLQRHALAPCAAR